MDILNEISVDVSPKDIEVCHRVSVSPKCTEARHRVSVSKNNSKKTIVRLSYKLSF